MRLTSIVIPNYNGLHLLEACIASIRQHTSVPYEIIVVDNGSSDGSVDYCCRSGLKVVSTPINKGFSYACNLGLTIANGDALMLLNNDTLVESNWLENLQGCLYSHERIGMVGPVTNYASGKQQIEGPFSVDDMKASMNIPNTSKWLATARLVGMCLLLKREVLQKVGYMDERFGLGHYEDDDYCYRVRQAGYELRIAGDCFVFHHGSQSFRKEGEDRVQALLELNKSKFIEKWGVDPHQFI